MPCFSSQINRQPKSPSVPEFHTPFKSQMEKEIADCLLRGDMPILPPESFAKSEDLEAKPEIPKVETAADVLKKRKLKRKQYFRRQQLKKQKEKRLYAPQTPSMLFVVAFVVVKSRTRMIRRNPAFRGRITTISFSR